MSSNRMGLLIGSLIVASISSACQGNLPDQDLGQDLTAPVIVASHETSRTSAIKAELGQDSVVRWNASTNKPGTVFAAWQPQGVVDTNRNQIEQADRVARRFVEKRESLFGVDSKDLRLTRTIKDKATTYLTYSQVAHGRPVVDAELSIRVTQDGRIPGYKNRLHPTDQIDPTSFADASISYEDAKHAAVKALQIKGSFIDASSTRSAVVLPKRVGRAFGYHCAYEVGLLSEKPVGEFQAYVDCAQGSVIYVRSTTVSSNHELNGRLLGQIIPDAFGDEPLTVPFPSVELSATNAPGLHAPFYTNTHGEFAISESDEHPFPEEIAIEARLQNHLMRVINANGKDNLLKRLISSNDYDVTLEYSDISASQEEQNVYYWLMLAFNHLQSALGTDGLGFPLTVVVNFGDGMDNAFFHPLVKTLAFGTGKKVLKNTAHFRDIIIHEFEHSVTYSIYGMNTSHEFGSMNEGFSDYFAAAITNDPDIAKGVFRDERETRALRSVANNHVYPTDVEGEVHFDSLIFSGTLWSLRTRGDAEWARRIDRLVHRARFGKSDTMADYMIDLLYVDDDNQNPFDGSPNMAAILDEFEDRGIEVGTQFEISRVLAKK